MMLRLLAIALTSFTLFLFGCSTTTIGDERLAAPALQIKGNTEETRKIEVLESLGQPWDVFHDSQDGLVGWLYMYLETALHPLTFVPYLGLAAGGSDTTAYTRFYCFDQEKILVGLAIGKDNYYTNMWRSAAELFDDEEVPEREGRRRDEMLSLGVGEGDASVKAGEIRWLGDDLVDFQARLFNECKENGLQELTEFDELM